MCNFPLGKLAHRVKWESASKHINRLRLPEELKKACFGKSYGSSFNFKGIKTCLTSPDAERALIQLREGHLKSTKAQL